ncbi:phage tail sheath family protein [Caproicibacter fermentans]|uniref:Phage tail sheath family protein n=1 Tax=Caproicibacter fermentans TaxID=2576756 RepID=A0A7G8TA21_9FIRM|nr:phage tail sheath subtilisin-like domain-containing protein [Caproicibacter fermentans]QNK40462.1 phage tail sheath family protein [Caproicibacter fermentans]
MAEYLSPGVYVEEFDSGIKPMDGVSTSTVGFVGMTARGPLTGVPQFVGSFAEFQRIFGGYLPKGIYGQRRFLPMAVEQFFANGGSRCFVMRLLDGTGAQASAADLGTLKITASSVGAWGDSIRVSCKRSPVNDKLCNLLVSSPEFEESYENVSMDPKSDGYLVRLLEKSLLVRAEYTPAEEVPDLYSLFPDSEEDKKNGNWVTVPLTGGCDCAKGENPADKINAAVLKGTDDGPNRRSGLCAMKDVAEVSILVCPGATDPAEVQEIVTHCAEMENRVCILDMPSGMNQVTDLQQYRAQFDSSFAAMYHPWVQVFETLEKKSVYMPPSGTMAGVYARTDTERGVHKAPANEVLRNCTGLETVFGKPEQDMLNPVGVNLIRNIQGLGIRVWGARTCSSDPSWKYVNVRRLFIYIEETIRRNTGWAVFEPNDQLLWTKVRGSIASFLGTLWRNGALMGATEAEAYFVNIGKGSTMTQDDILNGRLVCVIGVAPVRPAEFVIFRITQIMEQNG